MNEYHKIQTVFKRDPGTKFKTLLEGEFSLPEFSWLANNKWIFTEKVDGTNIRIKKDIDSISFGGRTDNAQIPTRLLDELTKMFYTENMRAVFGDICVCLYGEGYGAKIQKGGGNYIPDGNSFVLFDIKVGDIWLNRDSIEDIANKLNIKVVPIIGEGTLYDMVEKTKAGFNSQWGNFIAEGIVARPEFELLDRQGNRIITKIKHKDFIKEQ